MEFYSPEFCEAIVMTFHDTLIWCPQWYVWPYCSCCKRFLWPSASAHRMSGRHRKKLEWHQHRHSLTKLVS